MRRMRTSVALGLVLGLVGGVLVAIPSGAAVSRPVRRAVEVPPIVSPRMADAARMSDVVVAAALGGDGGPPPSVETAHQGRTRPRASGTDAPAEPVRELVAERTESTKTFVNDDGTKTLRLYDETAHVRDSRGAWSEVDGTLAVDARGEARPLVASEDVAFGARADAAALARVEFEGGGSIAFGLVGASRAPRVLDGPVARYEEAQPGVGVELSPRTRGVKEELILESRDAPDSFTFSMQLEGLSASLNEIGVIEYRDVAGAAVGRTPRAWMEDSSASPTSTRSYGIAYELLDGADNATLRMTLDRAWLDDPARVYPVRVDPTFFPTGGGADDTFVVEGYPNDNSYEDELLVGKIFGVRTRSYVHFDGINALVGKQIISASLAVFETWAPACGAPNERGLGVYRVTTPWGGDTMTGWPGAGLGERFMWASFAMGGSGCSPGSAFWASTAEATQAVRNWASGTWPNWGVALYVDPGSESDPVAAKKFLSADGYYFSDLGGPDAHPPYLDVVYNDPPSAPNQTSPGNGAQVHNLTPTLNATATDANGDDVDYAFVVCENPAMTVDCGGSGWIENGSWMVPASWLAWNMTYYWRAYASDGHAESVGPVFAYLPLNRAPSVPTAAFPGRDAVLTSTDLTFRANASSDPDGDVVHYQYQVATGPDGQHGRLATSPWTTGASWAPPPGTFQDGGTYYWVVRARDGIAPETTWATAVRFRIDLGLGRRPSMAFDEMGPAAVNLFNGNLVFNVGGPSFSTVGGPIGVDFVYNSQTPRQGGLTADYTQDVNANGALDSGEPRLLHRVDPTIAFAWGAESPHPALMAPHNWIVGWKGGIRVPGGQDGDWVLVAQAPGGDRTTVSVNGTPTSGNGTVSTPAIALASNGYAPISLTYRHAKGDASFRLKIRKATDAPGTELDVPADWLRPDQPTLPGGWSRTGEAFAAASYVQVRPMSATSTLVIDADGAEHAYTWTGTGWDAPAGEDGTLTAAADGTWSLAADDGFTYSFGVDGQLVDVTSATDDRRRAAPFYIYTRRNADAPLRMAFIFDITWRFVELEYGPSPNCPTAAGFDTTAPSDVLCKVTYNSFGGGSTDLYYSNGNLARVVNPGAVTWDFGYDTDGKLTQVRDPFTNDLVAANIFGDPAGDRHKTLIAYSGTKVASLTAPVANATMPEAERPRRAYTVGGGDWGPFGTVRTRGIDVDGANTNSRHVLSAESGHPILDWDAEGRMTNNEWDFFNDRVNRVTDPRGLVTTTKYDAAGRMTDVYGPGVASEFAADNTSATAPRTRTAYDEGIDGLQAAWYPNATLAGKPVTHTTSSLHDNIGTGSPATGIPTDGFSARMTGEVTMPATGSLTVAGDGARVFVDDIKVADSWGGPYATAVRADAPAAQWRLGDTG
ncbi:MAG: DNRLRE domain-containing protein, partial [Actinomycetota bacterium]